MIRQSLSLFSVALKSIPQFFLPFLRDPFFCFCFLFSCTHHTFRNQRHSFRQNKKAVATDDKLFHRLQIPSSLAFVLPPFFFVPPNVREKYKVSSHPRAEK